MQVSKIVFFFVEDVWSRKSENGLFFSLFCMQIIMMQNFFAYFSRKASGIILVT